MSESNLSSINDVGVSGWGSFVPKKILTNQDMEELVETSDEWITTRTGIRERHVLAAGEAPSTMAVEASRGALVSSNVSAEMLDLIVVATNLSDFPIPGTSPFLAQELDIPEDVPFFDLKAGCTGFLYGLDVGARCMGGGGYENVLVVGIEALSRFIDWTDRKTCVLFGDGAGAAVLSLGLNRGRILTSAIYGDCSKANLLTLERGGTRFPTHDDDYRDKSPFLQMEGGGVFKSAINMMEKSSIKVLEDAGYGVDDLDWVVPHQANLRIIEKLSTRLGVQMSQVINNVDRFANTSTASIPIAVDEAVSQELFSSGDLILFAAFGAGATYGSTLIRW